MPDNGYSPVPHPRRLIDAREVSIMFERKPSWFSTTRIRRRLYAQGFPLPVERGRWLRTAVEAYQERMGNRHLPPHPLAVTPARHSSRRPP